MTTETVSKWNPFSRPVPKFACLQDDNVLLQAWKKSHSYLRSKSWFADVLELDVSALDLQRFICDISFHMQLGEVSDLKPSPMAIVPAPKADEHPWEFREGRWLPGAKTKMAMRPLAHLALRDQVLNMAALISLADIVETEQGNTDLPSLEARLAGVASYGNRLLCDWSMDSSGQTKAEFTWGNAACYRKYYVDYQKFLMRSFDVCRHFYPMKPTGSELGVVSLDLQGFYDAIAPQEVIQSLKNICKRFDHSIDLEFFRALEALFSWEWAPITPEQKLILKEKKLPNGIPQGLVASGFFSNAYMVAFDRAITTEILREKANTRRGLRIIDYCRYVDDIRFVVEGSSELLKDEITEEVARWVKGKLKKHVASQKCNESKTAYLSLNELESRTMRPTIMAAIQEKLSGPMDMESLEEVSIAIDGLLNTVIAERDQGAPSDKKRKSKKGIGDGAELPLSQIHVVKHTVRDDTVIRFGAYRKFTTLRNRRFYMAAESSGNRSSSLNRIDAEMELASRQMIRLWSLDPSLTIVLRHAMNLCPSPELLAPVVEAIQGAFLHPSMSRALNSSQQQLAFTQSVAFYTAGELLKAGVIETGIDVSPDELPAKSDLLGYRELLGDFAESLLETARTPWYVSQQAVMFLLFIGRQP